MNSEADDPESDDGLLTEYEENDVSLFRLAKKLLSASTMPHIILITIISTALYLASNSDSLTNFSAMTFSSLSLGYGITAISSKNEKVQNWITLDENDSTEKSFLAKNLTKFKICIFPIAMSIVSFIVIITLFGEDGLFPAGYDFIPVGLGSLFVIWSIVQGTSFTQWASSASAKLSSSKNASGSPQISATIGGIAITFAALLLASLFYKMEDFEMSITEMLTSSIPFALIALSLYIANNIWTWKIKKLASMKTKLHTFSNRWTFICHLFVTWHLLTLWRQNFMGPTRTQIFLEELFLMILTVFIAIWSLTSKGYKSKLRLIDEDNALCWGLSFGYAYAGSVAMLTNVFDDISLVMQIGHLIVILTVLFVHKKVLASLLDSDDVSVEVNRIMAKSENSDENDDEIIEEEENSPTDLEVEDEKENLDSKDEDSWQEDQDVDWDKEEDSPVIDDVEWEEIIEVD